MIHSILNILFQVVLGHVSATMADLVNDDSDLPPLSQNSGSGHCHDGSKHGMPVLRLYFESLMVNIAPC